MFLRSSKWFETILITLWIWSWGNKARWDWSWRIITSKPSFSPSCPKIFQKNPTCMLFPHPSGPFSVTWTPHHTTGCVGSAFLDIYQFCECRNGWKSILYCWLSKLLTCREDRVRHSCTSHKRMIRFGTPNPWGCLIGDHDFLSVLRFPPLTVFC